MFVPEIDRSILFESRLNTSQFIARSVTSSSSRWVKPPVGQLRLDVDAGYDEDRGRFSIGAIVRDDAGNFIAASATPIRNPCSVTRGELMAILGGLQLCLSCSLSAVWVFSDSINAINAVNDRDECLGPEGVIADSIKDMLNLGCFLGVNFARRTAIGAAHKLAHFALSQNRSFTWSFLIVLFGCLILYLQTSINEYLIFKKKYYLNLCTLEQVQWAFKLWYQKLFEAISSLFC